METRIGGSKWNLGADRLQRGHSPVARDSDARTKRAIRQPEFRCRCNTRAHSHLTCPSLASWGSLENKSSWPFVHEFHLHHRAKAACCDRQSDPP